MTSMFNCSSALLLQDIYPIDRQSIEGWKKFTKLNCDYLNIKPFIGIDRIQQ